ncbi:hypothetical protein SK128_017642, partial [Halocaridina rubra]
GSKRKRLVSIYHAESNTVSRILVTMPEYKLMYFNTMGHGEIIRWIFAYGGIPYKDERLTREEFDKIKSSIKGGKLPILMVDDKQLPQSLAIARFVAKKARIVPEDDWESALIDALADSLHEMLFDLYKLRQTIPDYNEYVGKVRDEFFPKSIAPIAQALDERMKDRQWYTGDKLTWGDLIIGRAFAEMYNRQPEMLKKFTHLVSHMQKVCEMPAIKKWIETRPESPF